MSYIIPDLIRWVVLISYALHFWFCKVFMLSTPGGFSIIIWCLGVCNEHIQFLSFSALVQIFVNKAVLCQVLRGIKWLVKQQTYGVRSWTCALRSWWWLVAKIVGLWRWTVRPSLSGKISPWSSCWGSCHLLMIRRSSGLRGFVAGGEMPFVRALPIYPSLGICPFTFFKIFLILILFWKVMKLDW